MTRTVRDDRFDVGLHYLSASSRHVVPHPEGTGSLQTVVRSLEAAAAGGDLKPFAGETRLFITPGYRFRIVDMLLTNFHLPRSSLLMLVSAFGGYERLMSAYRHAIRQGYRFFSYGDAMLLHKAVT